MSEYLFLALVFLACPLLMVFMMRGNGHGASHDRVSLDDLRRRRDELNREIGEREWQGASSGARSAERV